MTDPGPCRRRTPERTFPARRPAPTGTQRTARCPGRAPRRTDIPPHIARPTAPARPGRVRTRRSSRSARGPADRRERAARPTLLRPLHRECRSPSSRDGANSPDRSARTCRPKAPPRPDMSAPRSYRLRYHGRCCPCRPPRTTRSRSPGPHVENYVMPNLLSANSTLGLINFWWHGTRQQQGRACITLSRLPGIPALDVRKLTPRQRKACPACYKELRKRSFLPANEAYRDDTRQMLDRRLLVDILAMRESILGPLDLLRLKWCSEPSVHGGKSTRPAG